MSDIKEYKCPCCAGGIEFDSKVQKLKCPYCDTEFETDILEDYDNELNSTESDDMSWQSTAGSEWDEGETDGLRTYICKSCGGEIIGDENTAATACPFCDNPIVMTGQFSGSLKPDYVIPFKFDKNAAKEALKKHYNGKKLLPRVFKDENHIDEIKGVYVPFWLFDADADADIRYKATRVKRWSDNRFDYTETSFYSVKRAGKIAFECVPVDGSSKIADELMESVEPFDFFLGAVDFKTAYLAGYLADKYDVSSDESIDRANERIRKSTENAFASTLKDYNSFEQVSASIRLKNGNARYVLYPVWILNTNWNGEKYTFAMNGQTGKFVGNLPLDKKAYARWLIGLTGAITAVAFIFSTIMWLF